MHGIDIDSHYLDNGLEVKVNGNTMTSPYTLQNGDVIIVTITSYIFKINDELYYSDETFNLSNQDIHITIECEPSLGITTTTINYTES